MPKSLLIVESPAKARTLKRYLGGSFDVKASVGHIRDLPVNRLGVDVTDDFKPQYVTIKGKGKIIADLQSAAKKADEIFLAPDPDREGEAIAWHIAHLLEKSKKPIRRALFHELTKKAIIEAIAKATDINQHRFEAQQTRRILDRLVGYQLSPLLWEKVRRGLSAGRVQSVAVRMICEREEAILAFEPEEYWSITETLQQDGSPAFAASLDQIAGKKAKVGDEATATTIVAELKTLPHTVSNIEKKQKKRAPSPPFITSTLQQDANRKLRFSAKKTMSLAQRLYEGIELGAEGPTGLITYMRTDSTRVNNDALADVRSFINNTYGSSYLPAKPNFYKTSKSAQDAHEAIRPTDVLQTPERVKPFLDRDHQALYTLIWKRFVASQMQHALFDQTSVLIKAGKYRLKAVGTIMRFLGFMTLYVEATDENGNAQQPGKNDNPPKPASDSDVTLPDLIADKELTVKGIEPSQHFTQPPPRYNEASLVKALEESGVGRPSTYASIISTIIDKEYVLLQQRKFIPTDLGKLVNSLLVQHFPKIIDVEFTASMENTLDLIEEGKTNWLDTLRDFYTPFKETLDTARIAMDSLKKQAIVTEIHCGECDGFMVIKFGKSGEFLACENFPKCKHTLNFIRDENGAVKPVAQEQPELSDETCDKCGKPMVFRQGRFGRFLACSGYPKCKNIRAQGIGVACPTPDCSGEVIQKISKKGKPFYSCNKYPKCKFATWDKPVARQCPDCGKPYLLTKQSSEGLQVFCADKKCGFSEKTPD